VNGSWRVVAPNGTASPVSRLRSTGQVAALPLHAASNSKTYKSGSVVPVKVAVTGCTDGLTPQIHVTPASGGDVKSSGQSNLDDFMRYAPLLPGFIYNWSTRGWPNATYTISITGLPGIDVLSDEVEIVRQK